MSLWAELVRLGLRWLMKPSSHPGVTITRRRERIGSFQRWVPRPPAGTEIVRGELGRVPALFVATPQSRAGPATRSCRPRAPGCRRGPTAP